MLLVNNRVVSSVLEQREHMYGSQKVVLLKLLSTKKITHLGELIIYIYYVCACLIVPEGSDQNLVGGGEELLIKLS
jgi:hypothetical protein